VTTILHRDLAAIKFCNRGARQFFERHGLDWSDFIKNGLDASRVEHIDDAMLRQVVAAARQREQKGLS
jgi:hypothetical protein